MEQKQRFFIYDRKEMGVLLILGVMVAIFAFTLGVHLGKRVGPKTETHGAHEATETVPTVSDSLPRGHELNEQAKGAQQAADESLNQALHEEVARTGIKLDNPRQTQLPEQSRSENAGATTTAGAPESHSASEAPRPAGEAQVDVVAAHRKPPAGKFTLQIGSFPAMVEARDQAESLEALGLRPFLRPAEVKGKRWYRIYVGGFPTKDAAEKAGNRYVKQHRIEAFVVSKMVD